MEGYSQSVIECCSLHIQPRCLSALQYSSPSSITKCGTRPSIGLVDIANRSAIHDVLGVVASLCV